MVLNDNEEQIITMLKDAGVPFPESSNIKDVEE